MHVLNNLGSVDKYHPPYYDVVGNDPDFDEMKKIVVDENMRPDVLPEWNCQQVRTSVLKFTNLAAQF